MVLSHNMCLHAVLKVSNCFATMPHCGLNQQLTLNDGLLVQSYMQAYDTNYPETIKLINDAVKQLKQELQENGEYELSGIGRLTLGIGGKYNFTPCEAGVLSPELYGLDTVSIPNVAQAEKQKPAIAAHDKKKVHIKRTEKIIPSALTANWLTTWQLPW